MPKSVQLTQEGLEELKAELKVLVEETLPAGIKRVTAAMAHGDLSENAEYHDAKEQQRFIETRISELEDIIERAVIVKQTKSVANVGMGSQVTVERKGKPGKHQTYHIVGEYEASPAEGKISTVSPLGKNLMGKKKGDEAIVQAPAGEITYIIVDVK